jgi:hypothetical protein
MDVPFVDVGMGLDLVGDSLGGILRVSTSTPANRSEARKHMSFVGGVAMSSSRSNEAV